MPTPIEILVVHVNKLHEIERMRLTGNLPADKQWALASVEFVLEDFMCSMTCAASASSLHKTLWTELYATYGRLREDDRKRLNTAFTEQIVQSDALEWLHAVTKTHGNLCPFCAKRHNNADWPPCDFAKFLTNHPISR